MKEKIWELCRSICCREITEDEPLIVTKVLDSFKIMELICSLEEEFHIQFSPDEIMDLDHFSSVDHIVELVRSKNSDGIIETGEDTDHGVYHRSGRREREPIKISHPK